MCLISFHVMSVHMCAFIVYIFHFPFHLFHFSMRSSMYLCFTIMRGELEIVQNALSNKTIYVLLTANDHCLFCLDFLLLDAHFGKNLQRGIVFELYQWNMFKLLLVFNFLGIAVFFFVILYCWRWYCWFLSDEILLWKNINWCYNNCSSFNILDTYVISNKNILWVGLHDWNEWLHYYCHMLFTFWYIKFMIRKGKGAFNYEVDTFSIMSAYLHSWIYAIRQIDNQSLIFVFSPNQISDEIFFLFDLILVWKN